MNIAHLRALRAVDTTRSVTRAAALLNVTQSAVSHTLSSLETELGLRLIVRERAGCRLTDAGRYLLPEAEQALRHVETLVEKAQLLADPTAATLRIGALPSVQRLLDPVLSAFSACFPAVALVRLDGTADEVGRWIEHGVVQVGVVAGERPGDAAVRLADDELCAVLARSHPCSGKPELSLADLAEHPFLLCLGYEKAVGRLYAAQGLRLVPAHRVWQVDTLLVMIKEGLGVSIVSGLALDGTDDDVVAVPLRPAAPRPLWLTAGGRVPSPAGKAFLDYVGALSPLS